MKFVLIVLLQFFLSSVSFSSEPLSEAEKVKLFSTKLLVDQSNFMEAYCIREFPEAKIDYQKTIDHLKKIVGPAVLKFDSEKYQVGAKQLTKMFEEAIVKPAAEKGYGLEMCQKYFANGMNMTPEKLSQIQDKAYSDYLNKSKTAQSPRSAATSPSSK